MSKRGHHPGSNGQTPSPAKPQEEKDAQDQLRSINTFLDAIFENIPNMVFVKEAKDLRFVRFNKAGELLLGYSRNDLLGKNDFDFFPPEQAAFFIQKDREALNRKEVTDIPEEPIETKTGLRWLHTKKIPIRDKDGTPLFLLGISEDITEQKKAKQQLLYFADIFESSSDFVGFARASDLQMMYINPAGKEMCSVTNNKDLSQYNLQDVFSEPTNALFHNEIMPAAIKHGSWKGEVTLVNLQSKKEIPVSMLFLSHKNAKGEIERFSTISRDISVAKQREQQVTNLNKELERKSNFLEASNKEISSFSYIVSHDLRAPIRAIHGFTKLFESHFSKDIDNLGIEWLHKVSEAATRMGHLIDDLLDFSKIGRKDVQKSTVSMNAMAQEIANDMLETFSGPHKPKITIHNLPDALCDKDLIHQVWTSLIQNAIKFSAGKADPTIEIGATTDNGINVYYVKDNGAGFDMKYYNKLFNVFQRLHHVNEFPGTGMGLAIAQRIVVRHDGKMWATGKVNEGATFYFSLP